MRWPIIFVLLSTAMAQKAYVAVSNGRIAVDTGVMTTFVPTSLTITPTGTGAAIGTTIQFSASVSGEFGNGSTACVGYGWSSSNPSFATINASTGLATAVSAGTTIITCADYGQSAPANLIVEVAPNFTNPATPCTAPCVLSSGTQNQAYSNTLAASGGTAPYTYSKTVGNWPTGVTMNSSGVFSGTPTVQATSTFTTQLCDSLSACVTLQMSLTILAPIVGGDGGPPDYSLASISQADTTTPLTSIFVSGAPTTTTCSGMCQNSTVDDTQLPGHQAGTYKYTRLTDAVSLNGKSISNFTSSGGDNDRMFSYPNGDYLYVQAEDGAYILHLGVTNHAVQVLNPGRTNVKTGRGISTSWLDETKFYDYEGANNAIYSKHLILDGNGNPTGTTAGTLVVDVTAPGTCPGVTTFPAGWHSDMGLSTNDDTFMFSLGSGQGHSDLSFAYSLTRGQGGGPGCAVINFKTGQFWGFTKCVPGTCTGSETPTVQFLDVPEQCWGSDGSIGAGIHNSQGSGNGNFIQVSLETAGGHFWSKGGCIDDGAGVIMVGWTDGSNQFCAHNECAGHPSIGLTSGLYGYFATGFSQRPLASIHTATLFWPNPPAPDHHCSWPHNNGGTYDDTLPWICAGNSATAAFGGPLTPHVYNNEVYAVSPILPTSQIGKRFGHTFACGTSAIYGWCDDHVPDGFGAGNAIGLASPKGDKFCFASSMLHSLGLDAAGKFRQEAFCIYMGPQ